VSDVTRNIFIDTSQLNKIVKGLDGFQKEMPRAFTSALNRTLAHVLTKTDSIVRNHYKVSKEEIRKPMKDHKATLNKPRAWIKIRSRRFTLSRFMSEDMKSPLQVLKLMKTNNIRVRVKKGKMKPVGGTPKPFIAFGKGDALQVFRRKGKKRYPVEVLRTVSPSQMVENLDVAKKIQVAANAMLEKRVEHEIQYRLEKVKGK
jgi:hypothetical protein